MKKAPFYFSIGFLASALVLNPISIQHSYANGLEHPPKMVVATINPSDIVNIPDANLKEVIANELGVSVTSKITKSQMKSLKYLEGDTISSLEGLQYATNLEELYLTDGNISDITPIVSLKNLRGLDLSYNNISDVSALSNLTNLSYLEVGTNNISDISALSKLEKLSALYIYENNISNISALSNLTNLSYLDVSMNYISDISVLSNLTNLKELDVSFNIILDFSPIKSLKNLKYVVKSNNPGSDRIKPTIKGNTNKTIYINQKFNLKANVTASDNIDGDLTSKIFIEGTVNTHKVGKYTIYYSVEDQFQNYTEVKRTITVKKDSVKPTFSGVTNKTIKFNNTFNPKGEVTAKDNIDGDITKNIKISGKVNVKKVGKYTLTYTITDSSGNKVIKKRSITVKK